MKARIILLGLLVAGCASSPGIVDTGRVKIADASSLPVPTRQDLAAVERVHLLGPFDELSVTVFGIEDLSRDKVRVDANGQILLPLAGVVDVGGKTPIEVAQIVEAKLRAGGVRNPQVTINETETVSQSVTVDGEVRMPGIYPVIGNMTLLRAVARAQGTSDTAEAQHVVVFRTVGGQKWAALYDLRAIRMAAYPDPDIYPNDVVVVGESRARRLLPTLLQATGVILTPIVYLLRR